MSTSLRTAAAAVSLLSLLALASCNKLDGKSIEAEIIKQFDAQGIQLKDAKCPATAEAKEGQVFECTVVVVGAEAKGPLTVKVTPTDSKGSVNFEIAKLLNIKKVETAISEQIGTSLKSEFASVTCPKGVLSDVGFKFECQGKLAEKDGGATARIMVTVKTEGGDVGFELMPGLIDVRSLEGQIGTALGQKGFNGAVECGVHFRVAKAGEEFECNAKPTAGNAVRVKVAVKDESGNVSWATVE